MNKRRRRPSADAPLALGIRANLGQFTLLVGVNALVGAMLGQERAIVPLIAGELFGITDFATALTFIAAFGLAKAPANLVAGRLCDRYGRKQVLIAGWLIGLPVPLILLWAPTWGWVVGANILLGVNQGLTWSATVIMKIDLAGPARRGLAMGINEAAGYLAVSISALATGFIAARFGLRPEPFYLGLVFAGLGLGMSVLFVRETKGHVSHEISRMGGDEAKTMRGWELFREVSVRNRSLSAVSQAGLVNNLNDGMAWGLFPIVFAGSGLSISRIGILAAVYPAVWGLGQVGTGPLSDRVGRKWPIVAGMGLQAVAIAGFALGDGFAVWMGAGVLLGMGTALVYPTLLAAIGDVAHPSWRASAVGVYRLWRDLGFVVGAVLSGVVADVAGPDAAIWVVALLTLASGAVVAVRMDETHRLE